MVFRKRKAVSFIVRKYSMMGERVFLHE
jgi:hypothetical protein